MPPPNPHTERPPPRGSLWGVGPCQPAFLMAMGRFFRDRGPFWEGTACSKPLRGRC